MFSFDVPDILSDEPSKITGIRRVAPGIYGLNVDLPSFIDAYLTKHGGTEIAWGPVEVGPFCQMLAKIAHSYAVAEYGMIGFNPLLLDVILDVENIDTAHLIGGTLDCPGNRITQQATSDLHGLMLYEKDVRGKKYLICDIQIFACCGTPIYTVVVGEIIPSDVATEINHSAQER